MLGQKSKNIGVKKYDEKRSETNWVPGFGSRKFPGSGVRRKPLAKAKGSYLNGGTEARRTVPASLTRPRPEGLAN